MSKDSRKGHQLVGLFKRMTLDLLIPESGYIEMPHNTYLPSKTHQETH